MYKRLDRLGRCRLVIFLPVEYDREVGNTSRYYRDILGKNILHKISIFEYLTQNLRNWFKNQNLNFLLIYIYKFNLLDKRNIVQPLEVVWEDMLRWYGLVVPHPPRAGYSFFRKMGNEGSIVSAPRQWDWAPT